LTRRFWEADCRPLAPDFPLADRLAYERAIFREYQRAPWPVYRAKRAEFLESWSRRHPEQAAGARVCLDLLAGWTPRVAVYPGSFHPFHLGHLSIVRQAERIFDKVILGVAINRQKPGAVEQLEARHAALSASLRHHEVTAIPGLLSDYLEASALSLAVVRGVRDGTDLEAELRYARFLDELRPTSQVVWVGCAAELQHLSSSAIRELESIEPGVGGRYLPTTRDIYGLVDTP
jgi:pantetheine-phosphate adenylyltransferase